MLRSFAAVTDDNTEILTVGTMPGTASLAAGEYYAHKRNHFWPIIFALFNGGRTLTSYEEKIALLLSHKIGLWDSLEYCDRQGSLDKDIRRERPNNFKVLFQSRPKIKRVVFNGLAARNYFLKYNDVSDGREYVLMPSTSPANASKSFEDKLLLWRRALDIGGRVIANK